MMAPKDLRLILTLLLFIFLTAGVNSQGCTTHEGTTGRCVSPSECPAIIQIVIAGQSGRDPAAASKLREILKSGCPFGGGTFTVCCATTGGLRGGPQTPRPLPPAGPVSPPLPPTASLLPKRCGTRSLVDKVINGVDAPLRAWPWVALLESTGENGRLSFVCGGVIISERYVLTAAHCVHPRTGFTLQSVRLGEHTITTDPDCSERVCIPPFQRVGVEQTVIHEDYGKPFGCSNCNDIALLRLSRPVSFDRAYIQPVCLPQNLQNDLGFSQNQFNGRFAWVAGWGTTHPTEIRQPDVLQEVLVKLNISLCTSDLLSFQNRDMVLCAGGAQQNIPQDTCRGDSGGPLVMANSGELNYYLVGVVSRGPRVCAATNTGTLYTSIHFHLPWILRNMRP